MVLLFQLVFEKLSYGIRIRISVTSPRISVTSLVKLRHLATVHASLAYVIYILHTSAEHVKDVSTERNIFMYDLGSECKIYSYTDIT